MERNGFTTSVGADAITVGEQQVRTRHSIQSSSALGAEAQRSQRRKALSATHVAKSVVSTDLELRQRGHAGRAAKSVTTKNHPDMHLSFAQ
jgi:hypothetical protein